MNRSYHIIRINKIIICNVSISIITFVFISLRIMLLYTVNKNIILLPKCDLFLLHLQIVHSFLFYSIFSHRSFNLKIQIVKVIALNLFASYLYRFCTYLCMDAFLYCSEYTYSNNGCCSFYI